MELVDIRDLKSFARRSVGVQVSPLAPFYKGVAQQAEQQALNL